MLSHLADLIAQRQFIRFWLARLAGTIANQMLMVAVGSVLFGGTGTLLVAALWFRLFPALARRDHMVQPGPQPARVA